MIAPVETVLARLEAVKAAGDGKWIAKCPAHDDRTPSLSVGVGKDGDRALLNCQAGCKVPAIAAAMGLAMSDLFDRNGNGHKEIVATYSYVDEGGGLLSEVVRFAPKDFRQRRPDGNGGWDWKLGNVRRVLYRLPKVLEAARAGGKVVVVEGEKDVHALEAKGLIATCNAGGAGKWKAPYAESLRGAKVAVIADRDEPGRKHAAEVAASLEGIAASVKVLEPAEGCKDVSDHLAAGHTLGAMAEADASVDVDADDDGGEKKSKPPQSQIILSLAREAGITCWATPTGEPYSTMPVDGHVEHHRLGSRPTRDFLSRLYYLQEEKAPSAQALQDVLGVLRGDALWGGGERVEVHVRHAATPDAIYIDLGDEDWRAIEIDAQGWRIVSDPPVRFRRPRGMLPLPEPAPGGSLDALRGLLNTDDTGWILVAGDLVGMLAPSGPYPILSFAGEQGAAKSSAARLIRALVDPNVAPLRSEPRDEHDLVIAASNGRLVALDNVSRLSPALSDGLCRISTGGGYGTRELYSDGEEVLFSETRPVVMTSIGEVATRGDLLDRAILVTLHPIPETQRLTEAQLEKRWAEIVPVALGGLLDAASTALRRCDEVHLERLPRMADHAIWVEAAAPALGWAAGEYIRVYDQMKRSASATALEDSPVTGPIRSLAEDGFSGSATQLLTALEGLAEEKTLRLKAWPKAANSLAALLRRLAGDLRIEGIEISDKTGHEGRRVWQIERVGKRSSPSSPSYPSRPQSQKSGDGPGDGLLDGDDPIVSGDDPQIEDRHHANGSVEPNPPPGDDGDDPLQAHSDLEDEAERIAAKFGVTA